MVFLKEVISQCPPRDSQVPHEMVYSLRKATGNETLSRIAEPFADQTCEIRGGGNERVEKCVLLEKYRAVLRSAERERGSSVLLQ